MHHVRRDPAQSVRGIETAAPHGAINPSFIEKKNPVHNKMVWTPSKNIGQSYNSNTNSSNSKNHNNNNNNNNINVGGNRRPLRPVSSTSKPSSPPPPTAASIATQLQTHWAALQEYLNSGDSTNRSTTTNNNNNTSNTAISSGRNALHTRSWKKLADDVLTTLSQLPFCLEEAVAYREELLPFLMAFAVAPIPNTSTQYAAISTLKQYLSTIAAVMEDGDRKDDGAEGKGGESDDKFYGANNNGINVSASRFLFDFLVIHHNALHAIEVALGVLFQDQQRIGVSVSDPHVRDNRTRMDAFIRLREEAQINRHLITELLEFLYVLLSVCPPAAAAALTYPELLELFAQLLLSASSSSSSSSTTLLSPLSPSEIPIPIADNDNGNRNSRDSLLRTTPVQVCYIAGLLHSMSIIPDAPEVLVAYRIHERILVYVRRALASIPMRATKRMGDGVSRTSTGESFQSHTMKPRTSTVGTNPDPHGNSERHDDDDDVTVTSLCMMLRVAVKLSVCPAAYLPLYSKLSLAKLLHRLVSSNWGDLVELGCLWLTDLLQRQRGEKRTPDSIRDMSNDGKRAKHTSSNKNNHNNNNNNNNNNNTRSDSSSDSDGSRNPHSNREEKDVDCSTLLARSVLRRTPMCDALMCVLCLDGFYRYSAVAAACLRELAISCPNEIACGMMRSIEMESERRQRPSVSVANRGILCLLIEHADAFETARKFFGVARPSRKHEHHTRNVSHKKEAKRKMDRNASRSSSSSSSLTDSGTLSVSSSTSSSSSSSCFSFEPSDEVSPYAAKGKSAFHSMGGSGATGRASKYNNAAFKSTNIILQSNFDQVPEDLLARLLLVTETVFAMGVAFGLAGDMEVALNFELLYRSDSRVPRALRRVISSTACSVLHYVDDSYFTRFPSVASKPFDRTSGNVSKRNGETEGIRSPAQWRAFIHSSLNRLFRVDASPMEEGPRVKDAPHGTSAPHPHRQTHPNECAEKPITSPSSSSQIPTTRTVRTHENTLHRSPHVRTMRDRDAPVNRRDGLFNNDASNISSPPQGGIQKNRVRPAAVNSGTTTLVKSSHASVPPVLSEYAVVRSSELMGSTFYHDSIQTILELSHLYIHARRHGRSAAEDGAPRDPRGTARKKGRAFSRSSSTSTSNTLSRSSSVASIASSSFSSATDDDDDDDEAAASERRFVSYRRSPRNWQKSSSQGRRKERGRSESSASNNSFVNPWAPPKKSDNAIPRSWRVTDLLRQDVLLFVVPLISMGRAESSKTTTPGKEPRNASAATGEEKEEEEEGAGSEATSLSAHLCAQLKEALTAVEHHTRNLGEVLLLCPLKDVIRRCVLRDLYINVYPALYFCLRFIVYHLTHSTEVYHKLIHPVSSNDDVDATPISHSIGAATTSGNVPRIDSPVSIPSPPVTMIHSGNVLEVYHKIGHALELIKRKQK